MSADKDILTKEMGLWERFGYALRKENGALFEEMLDRCKKKEYVDCAGNKGENFSAEALFLVLLFEQQKIINSIRNYCSSRIIVRYLVNIKGLSRLERHGIYQECIYINYLIERDSKLLVHICST